MEKKNQFVGDNGLLFLTENTEKRKPLVILKIREGIMTNHEYLL